MKYFWFSFVAVLVWLISTIAVVLVTDQPNWLVSSVACLICVVPAFGTMAMVGAMEHRGPVEAIGSVLVAPLLRMVAALLLGSIVYVMIPAIRQDPLRFIAWICLFYLSTLVTETALLLPKMRSKTSPVSTESLQP